MLIGHQKQWQFLKKSYEGGKISHAYLFAGPKHIGKRTFALEFIKFLNCEEKGSSVKPCQVCRSCKDIKRGAYPDLLLIEAKNPENSKNSIIKREIQINQIREMEYYLSLYPYLSSFKAAIVDRAHSMTQEAQNSFLKTLEEPKGNTLFILITEYPEMLLPTVLSRVQRINFYPLKKEEVESYLESKNVSKKKIKEIIDFSLGKPGEAIDLIENPQKLEGLKGGIKEIDKIVSSDLFYRFQYVRNLIEQKKDLKEVLDIWLRCFRKRMLANLRAGNYHSLSRLKKIIEDISRIQLLLSTTNINPKLALEVLMLEL